MSSVKQKELTERFEIGASSKICVSVYGRTISDLQARAAIAREFNPAFVELRLDYLNKLNPNGIRKLSKGLGGNEIFTLRSESEGGVSKVSEERRVQLLREIISTSKPPYLDIELATLKSFPDLVEEASAGGTRLIGSSHDFKSFEDPVKLKNSIQRIRNMKEFFAIKIVRRARNFSDNARILSLYQIANQISPAKLVAFCAGPLGILSRVACVPLGSPFTYVSLPGKKTAPGQLDPYIMQNLLQKW